MRNPCNFKIRKRKTQLPQEEFEHSHDNRRWSRNNNMCPNITISRYANWYVPVCHGLYWAVLVCPARRLGKRIIISSSPVAVVFVFVVVVLVAVAVVVSSPSHPAGFIPLNMG